MIHFNSPVLCGTYCIKNKRISVNLLPNKSVLKAGIRHMRMKTINVEYMQSFKNNNNVQSFCLYVIFAVKNFSKFFNIGFWKSTRSSLKQDLVKLRLNKCCWNWHNVLYLLKSFIFDLSLRSASSDPFLCLRALF